ncbi:hypothetical protein B0H14DRAFT_2651347 [Mycena olivaceomarginata]|nr:hypothetical protein B0H14DRAFT_2652439 [Mycena olivaceomarginata]KAJ7693520.1 hypothetical protein B0H14DRAFT_2651347 [Mycena olivaceomarginata]
MDKAEVWRDGNILPGQTVKGQRDFQTRKLDFLTHSSGCAFLLTTVGSCSRARGIFPAVEGHGSTVVIFTKQDGAISKETSQLLMDSPENTCNRSVRKEARRKAELEVINHMKKLEGEMEMPSVDADKLCQQLIDLTEECLTGPRIKNIAISVVWGRNLLKRGFWCLYWRCKTRVRSAKHVELDTIYLQEHVGKIAQFSPNGQTDRSSFRVCSFMMWVCPFAVSLLPLLTGPPLCLRSISMILLPLLTGPSSMINPPMFLSWLSQFSSLCPHPCVTHPQRLDTDCGLFHEDNKVPLHKKANTITAQVAAIVEEMKHRNIVPRLNLRHLPWKFPDREATILATELSQSIMANLM